MWCVSLQAERQLLFPDGDALFSQRVFVWSCVCLCLVLLVLAVVFLVCFSYYWEFKSSTHFPPDWGHVALRFLQVRRTAKTLMAQARQRSSLSGVGI